MLTADFVERWLTRPTIDPAWGWGHPGENCPGDREKLSCGKHRAAPYPSELAARKDDRLHWLFLRCVLDQTHARRYGGRARSWSQCLAEIGIRRPEDVADYFARSEGVPDV